MNILDFFVLGVGLAMDAFAVSICKGLGMSKINKKNMVLIAVFFGGFQALMPLLGYLLGNTFAEYVTQYSHYIACALLLAIGVKMIIDAIRERNDDLSDDGKLDIKELFLLAIATSIDAFAVGVTFAFYENINVWAAISIIGIVTAVIAAIGVVIGNVFGSRYKFPATILGGVVLILLGIKILLEGLGIIDF
ncbi:MAG: manganese efflux pump MntP family protein [Lachnospiraceae bacterium]|nr:manganese efflux pump MntP family protein [Lachnospiraceae bacterium]